MLRHLEEFYAGGREACLLGIMTIGDGRDVVSTHVHAAMEEWLDALAAVLRDAGLSDDVARERAEDTLTRIQGAVVVSRGLDRTAPFERLMRQLPDELLGSAHEPTAGER
jgi:hypothetical protein